jgi:hypothetical protein
MTRLRHSRLWQEVSSLADLIALFAVLLWLWALAMVGRLRR